MQLHAPRHLDKKTRLSILISMLFVLFPIDNSMATTKTCHPLLWPTSSPVINTALPIPYDTMTDLQKWSKKLVSQPSHPIQVLASSGKTDINDPNLIATREAFKDADRAAVLALTYRLTHTIDYLNKTKEILLSWANINQPTGNPIDETRLDGMLWAYDLISCDLTNHERTKILDWFERIRIKKMNWTFGKKTSTNNHRIHQLKMLLLLDKLLLRKKNWKIDVDNAEKYSTLNLNPQTGVSVDFIERSALYYHNYVLQPWLEINLITGCCWPPVKQAFSFLREKILTHRIEGEFSNSEAPVDALRAKGGFGYARKGGAFDITKAAPTIIVYYTLVRSNPESELWSIQQQAKPSPKLVFLNARRLLWHANKTPNRRSEIKNND